MWKTNMSTCDTNLPLFNITWTACYFDIVRSYQNSFWLLNLAFFLTDNNAVLIHPMISAMPVQVRPEVFVWIKSHLTFHYPNFTQHLTKTAPYIMYSISAMAYFCEPPFCVDCVTLPRKTPHVVSWDKHPGPSQQYNNVMNMYGLLCVIC